MKVKRMCPTASLPRYQTDGASGMDLHYHNPDSWAKTVLPGETALLTTGIAIELPTGLEAQVRPRSSLSKRGVNVALGTIDSDYRGEILVCVTNGSDVDWRVEPGDRIAQLVIAPVLRVPIDEVEELGDTRRGDGGFGSTGR